MGNLKRSYKFTLSFKYIATESASSGPLVHSRIFLAQYILQEKKLYQHNAISHAENINEEIKHQ